MHALEAGPVIDTKGIIGVGVEVSGTGVSPCGDKEIRGLVAVGFAANALASA